MTEIETGNVPGGTGVTLYSGAGITLPATGVDTAGSSTTLTSWTFCKLTLDSAATTPASKFEVIATVMPYGVDTAGAAVASGAVKRTCGFLVQAKSTSTVATTTPE
jgi:hypothetical protein